MKGDMEAIDMVGIRPTGPAARQGSIPKRVSAVRISASFQFVPAG
jgi:hypothetical protein